MHICWCCTLLGGTLAFGRHQHDQVIGKRHFCSNNCVFYMFRTFHKSQECYHVPFTRRFVQLLYILPPPETRGLPTFFFARAPVHFFGGRFGGRPAETRKMSSCRKPVDSGLKLLACKAVQILCMIDNFITSGSREWSLYLVKTGTVLRFLLVIVSSNIPIPVHMKKTQVTTLLPISLTIRLVCSTTPSIRQVL